MKSCCYNIIIFFVIISVTKGYEYKFEPQIMSNDLKGITSINNTVLCYGNNGVILRTKNDFQDIQQINIGYTQNIKKIVNFNNYFFAISQSKVFKSMNDGTNWVEIYNYQDEEINDINITSDNVYILKNNGNIDKFNLNFNLQYSYVNSDSTINSPTGLIITGTTLLYFDYSSNLNEIVLWKFNGYLFEKNLIKYFYQGTNKPIRISLIEPFFKENELYIFMKDNFVTSNSILLKIDIDNLTYDDIFHGKFNIGPIQSLTFYKKDIFVSYGDSINFPRICKLQINYDSLTFQQITKSGIDRYLLSSHKISSKFDLRDNSIEDFKFIDSNRIVVVGKNKFIAFSNDKGQNWKLISFFPMNETKVMTQNASADFPIPCYDNNNDKLFYINNNEVFHTSNNGITWNTQYENQAINNEKSLKMTVDYTGKVLIFADDSTQKIYISQNSGDNFSIFDKLNNSLGSEVINLNPEIMIGYSLRSHLIPYSIDTTIIKVYSISTKRIDSLLLMNFLVYKALKIANEIYLVGLERTDWISDSVSSYFSKIKGKILKSKDGINWYAVSNNIEINSFLTKITYNGIRVQLNGINNIFYYNNKILFSQSFLGSSYIPDLKNSLNILYSYDIRNNKIDSLMIPDNFNNSQGINNASVFFSIKGNFFVLCKNKIYKLYLNNKLCIEDTLYYKQIIPDWINYDEVSHYGDRIISTIESRDYFWLFLLRLNDFVDETGSHLFNQKLIPIRFPLYNLVSVNESSTEKSDVYLYNELPYPIPADNQVSVLFYWNSKYDIQMAKYELYDIYGEKVDKINFKFIQESNFNGRLILECNSLPTGVYLLQIKLGDEQKSIPLIINK